MARLTQPNKSKVYEFFLKNTDKTLEQIAKHFKVSDITISTTITNEYRRRLANEKEKIHQRRNVEGGSQLQFSKGVGSIH